MPGETSGTIGESIEFLNSLGLGFRQYQMAYAMPIPGAPLYEYARLSGIIADEDEYLEMISGKTTDRPYCNLTQEPDDVLISWADRVRREADTEFFARRLDSQAFGRLAEVVLGKLYSLRNLYWQKTLYQGLRDKYRVFMNRWTTKRNEAGEHGLPKSNLGFPKIDEVFEETDHTRENRKASLKEFNHRARIILDSEEIQSVI
jgi:hypothetical protein